MKNFKLISFILIVGVVPGALFFATGCKDNTTLAGYENLGSGSLKNLKTTITLGTNPDIYGNTYITSDLTLTNDNTYYLNGYIRVENGATLTIEPGVTIIGKSTMDNPASGSIADPETSGTLIIERGGKIEAAGEADNPIVFTGGEKRIGSWGGIIICGKATNNLLSGDNYVEGLPIPGTTPAVYGVANRNFNDNDNSGTLQYVRIEYAGTSLYEEFGDETNGLTLASVGKGTTIDHVMVCFGNGDGFKFYGGTVDAKYLVAYRNRDDDFDTDQGYCGRIQFGISYAVGIDDITVSPVNGFESNGDVDDDRTPGAPLTDGTFSNFTVIGPENPDGTIHAANYRFGALIRDESELDIFNSIICGWSYEQLYYETTSDFDVVSIVRNTTLAYATFPPYSANSTNVSGFSNIGDNIIANVTDIGFSTRDDSFPAETGLDVDAWNENNPDFAPRKEQSASFTHELLSSCNFFDQVDFRGAMGADGDIAEGTDWNIDSAWIDWTPGD